MKSLPLLLTASFLIASIPLAGAAEATCFRHPPQEGMAHPLAPGRYLFLDPASPSKFGEWEEANPAAGLQTEDCKSLSGTFTYFPKDHHNAILP